MAIRYDRYKVSVPGRLYLSMNECAGLVLLLLPEVREDTPELYGLLKTELLCGEWIHGYAGENTSYYEFGRRSRATFDYHKPNAENPDDVYMDVTLSSKVCGQTISWKTRLDQGDMLDMEILDTMDYYEPEAVHVHGFYDDDPWA